MAYGGRCYMKKTKGLKCFALTMLTSLVITACSQPAGDAAPGVSAPSRTDSIDGAASAQGEGTRPPMMTEQQLREAVAGLGQTGDDLDQKQEYYELLLSMDVFTESDYIELAQIYGSQGDSEGQRRMLSRALRLYPSKEYAERLSEIVVKRTDADMETAGLADNLMNALEQQNLPELKSLIQSEEWLKAMQENISGLGTRICYQAGGDTVQIFSDSPDVELTWQRSDGGFYYYRERGDGSVLGTADYGDGAYNGAVTVTYYDAEGNVNRVYSSTMSGNVCVGSITVTVDGKEYTGKLNDDGTTAEEQYKAVEELGGVLYAYSADGNSYLYQSGITAEAFKIDCSFLGLPVYEAWE